MLDYIGIGWSDNNKNIDQQIMFVRTPFGRAVDKKIYDTTLHTEMQIVWEPTFYGYM